MVLGLGDPLEISCEVEDPSEPVTWFKDDAWLVPTNRTRVSNRMLRIINVSYEDSGVYTCRHARTNTLLSNYTVKVTGECLGHPSNPKLLSQPLLQPMKASSN